MSESQNGRIGGGVLADNLLRQGVNLSFETDLLYLDVNSQRIGINTDSPGDALSVSTLIQTTGLVGTYANVATFELDTSRINNISGDINLNAANEIFATAIATEDLKIDFNRISTTTNNTNIDIRPDGIGVVNIRSNWNISGNLHSTGNITFSGNLVLGDSDEDSVTFESDVNSDLVPDQTNVSALGSATKQWRAIYSDLLNGLRIELDSITVNDTSLVTRQGNMFYVSTLGSDTNVGDHQHGAFRTLKHALAQSDGSTSGPTAIHIFPGEYEEEFPLTVPSHVSITGEDIRNTIIKPTLATKYNNAFLVEDSVTIENITIKDFYNSSTLEIASSDVIDNPSAVGGDWFGRAVAVDGDYAIVGAYREDAVGYNDSGKAYIYNVTTGALVHTLDNPNTGDALSDEFGYSVAISSNYAIVGARRTDDAGGSESGKAYIFNVTTGALVHTLDNPNRYSTSAGDEFGYSVAISGNYAIVGSSLDGTAGTIFEESGVAYIFNVTTGALVHTLDNPSSLKQFDLFGYSVAIDGNYAIVGAIGEEDAGGTYSGKAYIYDVTTGALLHTLDNPTAFTSQSDQFGGSVAISGNYAIVGAKYADDAGGNNSGNAYIFNVTTGALVHILDNPNDYGTGTSDNFGQSVAISGNYAIVGAWQEDDGGTGLGTQGGTGLSSGKAYIFNVVTGDLLQTLDNPNAYNTSASDFFGYAVAISGEHVIVGVPLEDVLGSSSNGKAYTYNLLITEEDRYAFRFTPGGLVNTRSPYIRNVSVITKGSIISADDPRGFNAGNAGGGAYIDGSVLDSSSLEASMLFHSVTFITPGVDCITMTNGVRVEWLNSFTYFANRGLYATQGITGKVMPDTSTRYGAELRSIGSACVYGNYGAVADGANTLMYLVGHNFGYVGVGANTSNDNTLSVQSQETTQLNLGKIYYTSTNENGTFKVGDAFFVDFETGITSIDASAVNFSGVSNITIQNGLDVTYIDGSRVDTGNIRISGNTIDTLDGPLILSSVTELFNIDTNPGLVVAKGTTLQQSNISSDIRYNTNTNIFEGYSTGGISFGGIYSTDRQTNILAHPTNNTLLFRADNIQTAEVHHYGLRLNGLLNNDIFFNNNSIVSTLSNSDIELRRSDDAVLNIFDIDVLDNTLTNKTNNALVIANTGRGYAKFNATTGLVIPYGTTAERPGSPQVGDTRWNTELEILEVFSGVFWQRAAGEGESVTEDVLKELVDIYTLVLG